jgi:hypothetical protein
MPLHVFLSHISTDKPAVEELARRLAKEGIQAWLDKWHLIPGDAWQPDLRRAFAESESCAVIVRAAIDRRVHNSGTRNGLIGS